MEQSVLDKQSLVDVAISMTGDIDSVFKIIAQNEGADFSKPIEANTILNVETVNNDLTEYLKTFRLGTDLEKFESESKWILRTGFWDDLGIWEDHAKWID